MRLAGSLGLAAVVATFAGCTWGTYTPGDGGVDSNGVDSNGMDSRGMDSGVRETAPTCGDGVCGPGETVSCPQDCFKDGGGTDS